MLVAVHAVGRMKAGPEQELAARYLDRFAKSGPAVGLEFSGVLGNRRRPRAIGRRATARRSRPAAGTARQGRRADRSRRTRQEPRLGRPRPKDRATCATAAAARLAFVIGGPDGLDPALRDEAELVLSFGCSPGRTSWCGSCWPSSSTGSRRSLPAIPIIALEPSEAVRWNQSTVWRGSSTNLTNCRAIFCIRDADRAYG